MATATTWQIDSTSLEHTEQIAEKIGKKLKGGEVIELISDLGGGKTAFVRGLANGIGSHDRVASPTFTLSHEYKAGKLTLYHFDFYRLSDPGIMTAEISELIGDPEAIIAVEWSDIVQHVLPEERLTVNITFSGETSRRLNIAVPSGLTYLTPKEK